MQARFAMGRSDGPGRWTALTAALLGWMFDGLEMGLFPLVARPALRDLLGSDVADEEIGGWFSVATAAFLIGAATGGVLFGWLGDRVGRVRAMTVSVLTYAIFSGLCGLAGSAGQVVGLRFIAALGMGGEWSLGVALVMEVWPDNSRALLAGLIGAAANFGYMLIAVVALGLSRNPLGLQNLLLSIGLSGDRVTWLTAHSSWRLLMLAGAAPAVLTFFIRLFVPESERWQREQTKGTTGNWVTADLYVVAVGAMAALMIIWLWAKDPGRLVGLSGQPSWLIWLAGPLLEPGWFIRITGTLVCLAVVTACYLYPVRRYFSRSGGTKSENNIELRRMLLGATLSGIALLGTWASIQWAPQWADQLAGGKDPNAKAFTQFSSALGAVIGSLAGALLAGRFGRRLAYAFLCLGSLATSLIFFGTNDSVDARFLITVFLAGGFTASFYGWLPLYLPELFRTRVRATGQGFSFNFGRILAAIGTLQTGALMKQFDGSYPKACSMMSLIYIVGLMVIWLAPETRGKALPD
jgi:MFS transporter, SHS family, sialic acid transporter